MVTSRRGLSSVDRGQGVCYQWKAKEQCPRGDKCSVVLISRLFSVEHRHCWQRNTCGTHQILPLCFDDWCLSVFSSITQLCDQEPKAYFWNSLWHDEQPEHQRHARRWFREFVRRAHDEDGQATTSRSTHVFGETCSFSGGRSFNQRTPMGPQSRAQVASKSCVDLSWAFASTKRFLVGKIRAVCDQTNS